MLTEHWLRTDEKVDLVALLAMLEAALALTTNDMAAWKWVVIATHSALQSAYACHLGAIGNSFLVAKPKDFQAWMEAHENGGPYPKMKMDSFLNLYAKLKRYEIYGYKFIPRDSQDRSIEKINEYRNDFIHFMPKSWSLEMSGLPDICNDCLDVINELNVHSLDLLWNDDSQRSSFRTLMSSCVEKIKSLKVGYGT